jgi:predicted Rossmann fold flavoprotein
MRIDSHPLPPMPELPEYDCVIAGAGAAGLAAGYFLSEAGKKILLLEAQAVPGKKLSAAGGGRGNVTNLNISATDYVSQNPHFVKSALASFSTQHCLNWLKQLRFSWQVKEQGRVFLKTLSRDLTDKLVGQIKDSGAQIKYNQAISQLEKKEFWIIKTADNQYTAHNVILALGGASWPALGGSFFGYQLAKKWGHHVIGPKPGLDGFKLKPPDHKIFKNLAGISALVKIKINQTFIQDQLLFTHNGLSGPAIFQSSLYWIPGNALLINWLPQAKVLDLLKTAKKQHPRQSPVSVLAKFMPKRLAQVLQKALWRAEVLSLGSQSDQSLNQAAKQLENYEIIPASVRGWKSAEITIGGVATDQILSGTLESKKHSGLYFVGELLDVAGKLGGYNLHWAFASGALAAKSIIKKN